MVLSVLIAGGVARSLALPDATAATQACSGFQVPLSADVAALVASKGPGTTFCFGSGTYRLSKPIVPKTNDVFEGKGKGESVIDAGRKVTTRFHRSGRHLWMAAHWVESLPSAGAPCRAAYRLCRDTNDLYLDGNPLARVGAMSALVAGTFFYDAAQHRVWIASDPSGHLVEAAVLRKAWQSSGADNVRIDGLTIEHVGGTGIQGRPNWTISNSEVRWNHVNGILDALTLTNNYIHDNGQAGYEENCQCPRSPTPHYFTGNEIANNNHGSYAGYQTSFDASGMKFMQTGGIVVTSNYVHDNGGPGLWSDTNVVNATYSGNRVFNNQGPGIEAEVSYAHSITNNDIEGNAGPGILIADSGPAEISGNTLTGNGFGIQETQIDRGAGVLGPYVLRGIHVHDNTITLKAGWNGLKDWQTQTSYTNDNGWTHNSYYLDCTHNPTPFVWHTGAAGYSNLNWAQWQAAGNDTTGTLKCITR